MCWYHGNMPPFVHSRKEKKTRYGDTDQNDPGSTITTQAKDKITSLSIVNYMNK